MRIGADSWLLFEIANRDKNAVKLLEEVEIGIHKLFISVLCFGELKVGMYRIGKPEVAERAIIKFLTIPNVKVVDVDMNVVDVGARRRHSLGLSFMDALILATSLVNDCDVFISGDSDFEIAEKQNIIKVMVPENVV